MDRGLSNDTCPAFSIGVQISRALEVKMMELLGEIELQFQPSPVPSPVPAHETSFDHRMDSAINSLQVRKISMSLSRRWTRAHACMCMPCLSSFRILMYTPATSGQKCRCP
jgi:hypothetical protein